jgi:hypothetical protein
VVTAVPEHLPAIPITPQVPIVLPDGIADLRKDIETALAQIPEGRSGALLAAATNRGLEGYVATRLNDKWSVSASVAKPWAQGGVQFKVAVMATW